MTSRSLLKEIRGTLKVFFRSGFFPPLDAFREEILEGLPDQDRNGNVTGQGNGRGIRSHLRICNSIDDVILFPYAFSASGRDPAICLLSVYGRHNDMS